MLSRFLRQTHPAMDALSSILIWLLIDVLLTGAGRALVRLVSFNAWRGETWGGNESNIYAAAGAFSFVRNGQRVITRLGLCFAGALAWMVLGLMALLA